MRMRFGGARNISVMCVARIKDFSAPTFCDKVFIVTTKVLYRSRCCWQSCLGMSRDMRAKQLSRIAFVDYVGARVMSSSRYVTQRRRDEAGWCCTPRQLNVLSSVKARCDLRATQKMIPSECRPILTKRAVDALCSAVAVLMIVAICRQRG
jgi:hypothetical protein